MASSVLVFAGKSVASPTISFLVNKAFSYLQNQYRKSQGIEDMNIRLQRNIPKIQSVSDVVDPDYIKEKKTLIHAWLWQLRDAVEEAEDAIHELEYYELKEKEKDQTMKRKCFQSVKHISVFGKTSDCPLKRFKNAMEGVDDEPVKGVNNFLALVDQIKRTTLDNSRVDEDVSC
uniref:Disease resistance N-terminal domain-containing protein n=1 Tax=Oryza punctata TaxID=4537 RepID=A0A0E0MKM1_ORYPU